MPSSDARAHSSLGLEKERRMLRKTNDNDNRDEDREAAAHITRQQHHLHLKLRNDAINLLSLLLDLSPSF